MDTYHVYNGREMVEKRIKDNPNLVKDTKSGAILLKRNKSVNDIEIENLKKEIKVLYNMVEKLISKINKANELIQKYIKLTENDKSN